MAGPKWACMACLLFLSLGISSAGRVTVVDKDKPEKFVLGGHIGWQPGFIGGIIEGALGHKSPQTPPTPPPSPDETSIAGTTDEGYGGGRGGGYGSGQVGGISGGGGGGGFGRGGGGGWGGGGGGWGGRGGGSGQDRHRGGDDCGDQSRCDSWDQSSGGSNCGDQSSGSDCRDQSGGDSRGQDGSPSIVVPGFTIPGFDIGGVIGGEIGISGGLYCTPIKCRDKKYCKGVRSHFENSNDPKMAGKHNMNHEEEDKHSMHTLAAAPPGAATPSSAPLNVASEPEPVDSLKQELSVVPKPSPESD